VWMVSWARVGRLTCQVTFGIAIRLRPPGDENMFGIIAAVLIVLWLLGSFAFHITSGFLYIVLLLGVISLAVYFISGKTTNAMTAGELRIRR
jgi:hypothetical protein